MNLTAYVAKLHTHHCPTCQRSAPCELASCSVEGRRRSCRALAEITLRKVRS